MAKKKSNPAATVAFEATGGQDNPGMMTEVESLINTSGAPDDAFEATAPINHSWIVEFIIKLCKFPEDSTMVAYINQQGWMELIHITTIRLYGVKDFHTVQDDGITYAAKPMLVHLCLFKCFLLYYKRQCRELFTTLSEDDVYYSFNRTRFEEYCSSDNYNDNLMGVSKTVPASGHSGNVVAPGGMTVQEFRRGVKRDKSHYVDLKDNKYFTSWNRGFVATAYMHHTQHVLNKHYVPQTANKKEGFQEIQTRIFAVMEEKLKSVKGKLLISEYEDTCNAQSVYCESKKHALASTAAQLSGDTMKQYITTARYPGTWRGNSFNFVLHFK